MIRRRPSSRSVEWLGQRWKGYLGLDGLSLVSERGDLVRWTPEETMTALDVLRGRLPVPDLAGVGDPVGWARVLTAATAIHTLWEKEAKDGA